MASASDALLFSCLQNGPALHRKFNSMQSRVITSQRRDCTVQTRLTRARTHTHTGAHTQ